MQPSEFFLMEVCDQTEMEFLASTEVGKFHVAERSRV
jgi:hypothetical protein